VFGDPLHTDLGRIVGAEHVLQAPPLGSPYNHDASRRRGVAGRADAVALPGSAAEVAEVVRWCYAHDVAIVPRGGGSGLVGGAVALEGGVVCSMERMNRVRELEPGLWRMYPEAGVRTSDVRRLARENGLMFAPDPGASEQSQIGGNVATNAGGPHARKYGATGSWVTGLEAVIPPGERITLGGVARRDVAGYDLKSLLIGSEGTLGVITAVRLGLRPAPEAAIALVVFLRSRAEGCAAILDLLAAGLQPAVLDFLDGDTLDIVARAYPGTPGREGVPAGAGFALIVEVDGTSAQAQAQRAELRELLGGAAVAIDEPRDAVALWRWRDGFNGAVTAARGGKLSEDVVFPLERLAAALERFGEIAAEHGLRSCAWGHGGDGNVHGTVLVDPEREAELDAAEAVGAELFALAITLGGSITGEHGVGWVKRGWLARQWGDARAVELHEQIKRVFDPKGLLNPGKKLARWPPGAASAGGGS
jgi:glycolate oxidase subunit GlcD